MNWFLYATLSLVLISFNIQPILPQTDSTKSTIDPHQEYWDGIAKIPYPKLNKKDLHHLTSTYVVGTINKWIEGEAFNDFKCKYHNLTKRRSTTLKNTNNNIEGTLELTKENGETLTFDFQVLMSVFLVYSDHYEWKVHRIHAKNKKEDEWMRLHEFVQQL